MERAKALQEEAAVPRRRSCEIHARYDPDTDAKGGPGKVEANCKQANLIVLEIPRLDVTNYRFAWI